MLNPQRKLLPLQWKALPTKPWNCNGHGDSSFDSFANIFMKTFGGKSQRSDVYSSCLPNIAKDDPSLAPTPMKIHYLDLDQL